MLSLEFFITSFIVVLIPGTGVVCTVSAGLAQGRKASVFAALGCTAGNPSFQGTLYDKAAHRP
jgi:threonine/homoserine/homoserine lactone efflux protein